jgi:hypothetical protein
VAQDAIPDLEPPDGGAHLDHRARTIGADDERVLDPRIDEFTDGLRCAIDRIDRHSGVLDDDFVGPGPDVGRGPDGQCAVFREDPGGFVVWHLVSRS